MYRIRFHGRGGQGMKTASRILGTALFHEGFEVQDAPRYGAERRGAPMFAYVRADRQPIKERGVIISPDLVIVADETLIAIPAATVLQGIDAHTVLLILSRDPARIWQDRLDLTCPIFTLSPDNEASNLHSRCYEGTICASAAARLLGGVSWEALAHAINVELVELGKEVIENNLKRGREAYAQLRPHQGRVVSAPAISAEFFARPAWIELGFDDARLSAPAIHATNTSELVNTGLWRTVRPEIDRTRCRHCWWLCSTFCPDGAIRVNGDGCPQIDYDHCKGCLVCLVQCPNHAIAAVSEQEAQGRQPEGETS